MKIQSAITLLSGLIFISFVADSAEARRDQLRQRRQKARIAEGVQSGELTPNEARKLRRGQKRIDRAQERATADGVVTDKEKAKLERMEDRQSRKIYKEKHDNQDAGGNGSATGDANSEAPTAE
jgi:hypothetical protein